MRYQTVLFDFDGVIADNSVGIFSGVRYALGQMNAPIPDESTLRKFIGPTLWDSFQEFCCFTEDEANQAVAHYRHYYHDKGVTQVTIYPAIKELLQTLYDGGVILSTASSKPQVFVQKILEEAGLSRYFHHIVGSDLKGTHRTKTDVCRLALALTDADPSRTVLIGDRYFDAEGAAHCGIDFIAVLYGFGEREEFAPYPTAFIANTPIDVLTFMQTANGPLDC